MSRNVDFLMNYNDGFIRPTVTEVFDLMNVAASRHNFDDWREVHKIIGVNQRRFSRWIKHIKQDPMHTSSITRNNFNLLIVAALGDDSFNPLLIVEDIDSFVPSNYITNAENYVCPPVQVSSALVGKNAALKRSRSELAVLLGVKSDILALNMENSTLPFSIWALLLLMAGVQSNKIFFNECSDD